MLRACPAAVAADVSGCILAAISATLATMTCTARTMRWIRGNVLLRSFSARDPRSTPAEDERLAAALMSVMRRPDFDPASLYPWLARFVAIEKRVWQQSPPEAAALDAAQNARNLLRSLHLLLSMPQPDPSLSTTDAVIPDLR